MANTDSFAATLRRELFVVLSMVRRAAVITWWHWPRVMLWFVLGILAQDQLITFAAWVGGTINGVAGLAVMALAVLIRLVALVAMLLLLRDGMPALLSVAPIPELAQDRRRDFAESVLAAILPFFAFYLAWGFLREDMRSYFGQLLPYQVNLDEQFALSWFTGGVIVLTFALRTVIRRYTAKLPRLTTLIAVYLETVWVFLVALVVTQVVDNVTVWVTSRQGIAWALDARRWIAEQIKPLDWLFNAVGWLLGEVGGVVLLPLAWLAIAGVVYGQTITTETLAARVAKTTVVSRAVSDAPVLQRVRRHLTVPGWLRKRARDVWALIVARFKPLGDAIALMWHVGPVLIAVYVLLFRSIEWLEASLKFLGYRIVGPHDIYFWADYGDIIYFVGAVLVQPLTMGLIAAAYNAILAHSRARAVAVAKTRADQAAQRRDLPTAAPEVPTVDRRRPAD